MSAQFDGTRQSGAFGYSLNATGTTLASGSHEGTVKLWAPPHGPLYTKTLRSDKPYERMNITEHKRRYSRARSVTLKTLGAIEKL